MTTRSSTPLALVTLLAAGAALPATAVLATGCATAQPATSSPAVPSGAPPAAEPATPPAAAPAEPAPAPAAAPEPAEPEVYKNTLKWSTASEVDNFGYDVYRGDSENGPFTRINETPIPGAGTTDLPSRYQYVDDTIDPDREYWYYVESISMSGQRERFTPVFKAPPKRKPPTAEPDGAAP